LRLGPAYKRRLGIFPAPALQDDTVDEFIFLIEEAPEGGYTAMALGESIFTEADDLESLPGQVRDAVRCHFDESDVPKVAWLLG
jgi:hypothetical protein